MHCAFLYKQYVELSQMDRSFADIVKYPYLNYKINEPILMLGDCWEHIFKYLSGKDYNNLLLVSRGFYIVIHRKISLICWSIKQLKKFKCFRIEKYTTMCQKMRKIKGVKQLEELIAFPNINEIEFTKQFPTNRNKKKRELRCGFIPKSVKVIHFGGFNSIIHPGSIPRWIVEIYFGDCFNQYLDPLVFSDLEHLKIIVFGKSFNNANEVMNSKALPKSLEILEINSIYFNQDLTKLLDNLPNLKTLRLGAGFNMPIITLPHNIKNLIVSDNYNQDLMSCIVNSKITYLKIGKGYKHYIDPELIKRKRIINIDIDEESYKEFLFNRWKGSLS